MTNSPPPESPERPPSTAEEAVEQLERKRKRPGGAGPGPQGGSGGGGPGVDSGPKHDSRGLNDEHGGETDDDGTGTSTTGARDGADLSDKFDEGAGAEILEKGIAL